MSDSTAHNLTHTTTKFTFLTKTKHCRFTFSHWDITLKTNSKTTATKKTKRTKKKKIKTHDKKKLKKKPF